MQTQGMLSVEELAELAHTGQIDTVLCQFTDLQGRFMGKRVLPDLFLEEVLGSEGLHACLYLLAIDMEMEPLPGYAYASWDTGYGDFRMIPDLATLRLCPWLEKTAMVICDIADEETSEPTAVAPRAILRAQIAAAAEMGYLIKTGSELEFYLFKDSFDPVAARAYQQARPSSSYIMDYHMLQTTKDEWFIRQVRNGMRAAGIPVEFSKGEFGKGQHEINITYSDALSNADHHALYKHGAKEIAALNDVAITFMAKWTMAEAGSSCHLHSSVWSSDGASSLMWSDDGEHHMSDTYRWYLGGLMTTAREMAWMYAPFVNSFKRYQLGSWAPTAIVWARDNRTAGYRTVGEHKGSRGESRRPGADANPYLAFAATIASGMWGIRNQVEPPAIFEGNAYEAKDVPRVPTSLHEAIDAFRGSTVAREAFGDFVFEHLLNTAEQEQIVFDNQVVTDWGLARYFERGYRSPLAGEQLPSDDQPLDVARPFVDLLELRVTQPFLDRVLAGVAVAAERHHRRVGRVPRRLRGCQLRHRRLGPERLAGVGQIGSVQGQQPRLIERHLRVDQPEADGLELVDLRAEGLALLRVVDGVLERRAPDPDRIGRKRHARPLERAHHPVEALPLVADPTILGHEAVSEEQLAGRIAARAELRKRPANGEPLIALLDHE